MAEKNKSVKKLKRAPARTPEEVEQRCVYLAYREAEKRLEEGTATSQMLSHFLKIGSSRENAEMIKLEADTRLQLAKEENLQTVDKMVSLIEDAKRAFTKYSGGGDDYDEENL